VWILGLFVRLVDLQVIRNDEFVRRAKKQQERTVELAPRRGTIEDADGKPLAVNARADSVFAIPADVIDAARESALLSPVLRVPPKELQKKLTSADREFVWLARRVPNGVADRVRALMAEKRVPGVALVPESTRRYPEGPLAAAVLGYVGTDNQGLGGLEYRYDSEVRGRPARVTLQKDAAQRPYAVRSREGGDAPAEGIEGASLRLTLRAAIQHAAERELVRVAAQARPKGASAVVLDPETGAILALASWPPFDPNRFGEADAEARKCRPLTDAYEPGSTLKVVAAGAALDGGMIGPDDPIDCGGGTLTIGSTTIHEHGGKAWGALTIGDILAHSSNIGIAHVALGLGRGPFYKALRSFGFGEKTGVELEGETSGLVKDTSQWSALSLPTMAFGQEIGVTVLQMARAYAAVANGGLLPSLHVVAGMKRSGSAEFRSMPRPEPRRVLSAGTARQMRRLLARVVEMGTGKDAAIPGYTVAGKTGTAQKAVAGAGYSKDKTVASFIGFVPAEKPRAVIAVVVDEPRGKTYGGDVAAPVFSRIGAEVMCLLREPPRRPDGARAPILTADLSAGAATASVGARLAGAGVVPAANRTEPEIGEDAVPDLTGRSSRDAVRLLATRGIAARLRGAGFVVSQEPRPGSPARRGATCALVLSPAHGARDGSADGGLP
jgi:cell division protein FtsI (penicillin-binding protein 3)